MKLKTLGIILFVYLGYETALKAQYIYGQVVDSKNANPLAKASIRINTKGTLSDNNGHFKISISEFNTINKQKIHISYIGYKTQEIPIHLNNKPIIVQLEENAKNLNEVIVSSSARSLVEEAIRKIPENYTDHPYTLRGILSETNRQKKDEILYELKAIIAGKMEPYSNQKKEVDVKIDAIERRNQVDLDTITFVKWGGTAKVIEYFDFVRQREKVFDLKQTKKYRYFIEDIIEKNGRPTYKINVSKLSKKKEMLGYIHLDQESLAFENIQFFKSNEDSLPSKSLSRKKTMSTAIHTQYRLINTKWYLSEIKVSLEEIYLSIPTYINVNFLAIEYDSTNILNLKYQEKYQNVELLSDYVNKGNADQRTKLQTKIPHPYHYYLQFDTLGYLKKPIFESKESTSERNFKRFFKKMPKINIEVGLSTNLQQSTMQPEIHSSLINLPYGFAISKDQFLRQHFPIISNFGIHIVLWKNLEVGFNSKLSLPFISRQSENFINSMIAYRFLLNKKHRPISISPNLHYGTLKILKKMDDITCTQQQSELLGLNDEKLAIALESRVNLCTLGLQFGIELNKKKYLELGISYNIPTSNSREFWVFKETKGFLFNSEKKIQNTQTIYQYPNNTFSLSLTYKFLPYAK